MNNSSQNKKQIFLVGMMGTGKSTIGHLLANYLKLKCLDSDQWIESQTSLSIPEIFKSKGESHFRTLEKIFITQELPRERCVISCGGGLCIHPGMMNTLKSKGIVICLWASPNEIIKRTKDEKGRPLLATSNPSQKINEILEVRKSIYQSADHIVQTDGLLPEEVTQHILDIL
jgi:shikimate kinase